MHVHHRLHYELSHPLTQTRVVQQDDRSEPTCACKLLHNHRLQKYKGCIYSMDQVLTGNEGKPTQWTIPRVTASACCYGGLWCSARIAYHGQTTNLHATHAAAEMLMACQAILSKRC